MAMYQSPSPRLVPRTRLITAASAPTDWQEEFPREVWHVMMDYFDHWPTTRRDNGLASASRKMNLWWRKMRRQEIFYMAVEAIIYIQDCWQLSAFEAIENLLAMIYPNYIEYLNN